MSQTETLLLFVLGFCVALFVVLLFGRGLWALIGSWSGWRESRKVPFAIRELQAERDSLKAEKAIMAQKLEASLNDMKMRLAEQMAEVSRNRNRLLDMGQTQKEREATINHIQTQLDDKSAQLLSAQSQIEENVKAINLAYAKLALREEEHVKMQKLLKETQASLLMRDEKVRNLMDETKALREIAKVPQGTLDAHMFQSKIDRTPLAPVLGAPATASLTNSFETRFANSNSGNPLAISAENPTPSDQYENFGSHEQSDDLDRGVSNVLSLAERVRNSQADAKKA